MESVGVSSFEWIGNRYRPEGVAAHASTQRWWRKLGRFVQRLGKKVPRADGLRPETWALPHAYGHIEDGGETPINPESEA